jgi:hypothetical protein
MKGDRVDERSLLHRAPARARWRSPHARRTKGSALIEVWTTARNALGACRPPSGTTVRRQPATPRRQPQHPRSTAPRQSPSRTVCNSPAGPLEAGRATAKLLAHTDPNAACISSSQPPFAGVLRRPIESALGRPVKPGDDEREDGAVAFFPVILLGGRTLAFPRHVSPGLCKSFRPKEGVGNAGCPVHPQPRVRKWWLECTRVFTASSPENARHPHAMVYGLYRALVSAKSARMCKRAALTSRPSLDLSPFALKGRKSLTGSVGQIRCLPQPEQLHGLRARTEQGRELDDGTK